MAALAVLITNLLVFPASSCSEIIGLEFDHESRNNIPLGPPPGKAPCKKLDKLT